MIRPSGQGEDLLREKRFRRFSSSGREREAGAARLALERKFRVSRGAGVFSLPEACPSRAAGGRITVGCWTLSAACCGLPQTLRRGADPSRERAVNLPSVRSSANLRESPRKLKDFYRTINVVRIYCEKSVYADSVRDHACRLFTQIPRDALLLTPDSLQSRQMQTRRFDTTDKAAMLAAATGVLQDLGFSLEEAEVPLGVLVGSKKRDASSTTQLAGAFIIAALGGGQVPVDSHQTIRVSMVMRENTGAPGSRAPMKNLSSAELTSVRADIERNIAAGLRKNYSRDVSDKAARQAADNAVKVIEADLKKILSVQSSGGESIVRVTFQRIIFDTAGQITRAEQINDPAIYREFYDKLSKSVFLEAHEI